MRITKYALAVAGDSDALETAVNNLLAEGWEPHGGVAMTNWFEPWENGRKGYTETSTNCALAQAMVKRTAD